MGGERKILLNREEMEGGKVSGLSRTIKLNEGLVI